MKKSNLFLILMIAAIFGLSISWAKLRDRWMKISQDSGQKSEEPKEIPLSPKTEPESIATQPPQTFIPEELSKAREPARPEQRLKTKCLEGIEFLSGFQWGKIHDTTRNYNVAPLLVDFNFNLKPLLQKININPVQLVQLQIEPFLGFISSPRFNVEVGNSFLFKVGLLPRSWKFQPYVKVGVGIIFVSQHFGEQGTKFNFIESGCFGMHYFIRKNIALTLEGRKRHLSNAGIKEPNHGVNSYFVVGGVSYDF